MRITRCVRWSLVAIGAACGTRTDSAAGRPQIDTLPDGIVRVANNGPTAWADTNGWKLVLESTIAPADNTPGQFNLPTGLVVDSRGRIFVMDRKPAVIKVYAPDGSFIGTIGREGSGPGEFRERGLLTISHDTLFLHDPGQSRTQTFTTDGDFVHGWVSLCCWQMRVAGDDSGRTTVPGMIRADSTAKSFLAGAGYIRYYADGRVADTLILPPQPETRTWQVAVNNDSIAMSVPLMPGMQAAFDRAGHFVWGVQDRYQFVVSRNGLDTLRLFSSSADRFPIPDSIRQEEYDQAIKSDPAMSSVASSTTFPGIYGLDVDRERRLRQLWVSRPGPKSDTTSSMSSHRTASSSARSGAVSQPLADVLDPRPSMSSARTMT